MKLIKLTLIWITLPFILCWLVIVCFIGGGLASALPLEPPATPEKAQEYGMVASELGVNWDIVLITDAIFAEQEGKSGIEDVNPIPTSLEFLIALEDVEKWEIVGYESSEDGEESSPVYDWVFSHTNQYYAKAGILSYLEISEEELETLSPSVIMSKLQSVSEKKSDTGTRYKAYIVANTNLEEVLGDYIGLKPENIKMILELYEANYLAEIYFGGTLAFSGSYELPEIHKGNVTRNELAQVAVSIIGHPYYWGGKSPVLGEPVGPLDCSGYIDWVYYQCFGSTIGGGRVPSHVIQNGTALQFYSCEDISESELRIGDLGFYEDPANVKTYNHVGIYIGKINGKNAFIHCGGSSFGYKPERPNGRVGVSINTRGITNTLNPIGNENFTPAMSGSDFKLFRRPQFQFLDDIVDE